jgi:hypothetical protein
LDLLLRKRKRPRRRTGSGRVRERLEAVEMPLKRTNQSQKACQRDLVWVLINACLFDRLDSSALGKVRHVGSSRQERGLGFELAGGLFELEMPKLMRKKRKPLRSEVRRDMEVFE